MTSLYKYACLSVCCSVRACVSASGRVRMSRVFVLQSKQKQKKKKKTCNTVKLFDPLFSPNVLCLHQKWTRTKEGAGSRDLVCI